VAPTVNTFVPPPRVGVIPAVCTKVPAVTPSVPPASALVSVIGAAGNRIEKVLVPSPVTVKDAAAPAPVENALAPPVIDLLPSAAASTTVPAVALAPTVPKFKSTVFAMLIGVTSVAVVEAVTEDCALELTANPTKTNNKMLNFFMIFVFYFFVFTFLFFYLSILFYFFIFQNPAI
jgi:hypothetical protein